MKAVYLVFILFVASLGFAKDYPKPPAIERPGGAFWGGYSRLIVPQSGLDLGALHSSLLLSVDEIILRGPLVTNGNGLQIETKHLVFEKGGKITAFNGKPAEDQTRKPPSLNKSAARQGSTGANPGDRGGSGANGDPGKDGLSGNPGMNTP